MSRRVRGGGANRRSFRPQGDGVLESRCLLAAVVTHVAYGGQIAEVRAPDLGRFNIQITGGGVVRATPMAGGKVKIIINGSGPNSVVTINPVEHVPMAKGLAHHYPIPQAVSSAFLNVGEVDVTSGIIDQILGYQTANLSGPINISGTNTVDRIAFNSYQPGASIRTAGSLNTLDSYTDVNLSGGPGISVGGDLNWVQIGGNLSLSGGSSLVVGRDLGLTAQPGKGTDSGGQGGFVEGNVSIANGSSFTITRSLQAPFIVNGNLSGAANISVAFGASNFFIRGAVS